MSECADEIPRGSARYEEVALESGGPDSFAPRSTTFGPRFQMALFFLAGTTLMVSHHFFYMFLNGKAVDSPLFASHRCSFTNQSVSSILGNTIAYAARTVLSAGIGIVFIQVLWSKLRKEQFSVKQIDALVACKGDPFAHSALPTWRYAFWLAAIAAMATLMAFISIIAPGSLRIESAEFSFSTPCTVRTVSLETSNVATYTINSTDGGMEFLGARAGLMGLATQVLMGGAALQARNPCNGTCEYEIKFNAPFANCTPVNSSFNFTSWLPPPDNDSSPVRIWSAKSSPSSGVWLVAATKDLSTSSQSAVNCSTYNATHFAVVTHSNTSTSMIRINRTDVHEKLDFKFNSSAKAQDHTGMQYDAVISAFADILKGSVHYDPRRQEFRVNDNLFVAYSPSFAGSMGQPWTSSLDLKTVLPSLMQNISVSLLNDQLSQGQNSTTAPLDTTCYYTSSTYRYNETRLLATYGIALVITLLCTFFGYRVIRSNRCEESVHFSRILGAILNMSLFGDRYELSMLSRLTANGSGEGQLRLADTVHG